MGDDFLPAPFKGLFSECGDQPDNGEKRPDHAGFWYVERNEGEAATIQPLNQNYVPTGKREMIDTDVLLSNYCPEPALYQKKVRPSMERMEKAIERGDALREEGQFSRAEGHYDTALSLDENNVRACFGIGIVYVRKNDKDKAVATLEKLLTLEAAFDARYMRLYNEFGIALRKMKMFDEALRFYAKGAEAAADDDHLMFNISRAYWEKDEFGEALAYLDKALAINAELSPARLMKQHLLKQHPELAGQAAPMPPTPGTGEPDMQEGVSLPLADEKPAAPPADEPPGGKDGTVLEEQAEESGEAGGTPAPAAADEAAVGEAAVGDAAADAPPGDAPLPDQPPRDDPPKDEAPKDEAPKDEALDEGADADVGDDVGDKPEIVEKDGAGG